MRSLIESLVDALESAGGWATGQLSKQSRGSRKRPFVKKQTNRLARRQAKLGLRHHPGSMSSKSKVHYGGYAD